MRVQVSFVLSLVAHCSEPELSALQSVVDRRRVAHDSSSTSIVLQTSVSGEMLPHFSEPIADIKEITEVLAEPNVSLSAVHDTDASDADVADAMIVILADAVTVAVASMLLTPDTTLWHVAVFDADALTDAEPSITMSAVAVFDALADIALAPLITI